MHPANCHCWRPTTIRRWHSFGRHPLGSHMRSATVCPAADAYVEVPSAPERSGDPEARTVPSPRSNRGRWIGRVEPVVHRLSDSLESIRRFVLDCHVTGVVTVRRIDDVVGWHVIDRSDAIHAVPLNHTPECRRAIGTNDAEVERSTACKNVRARWTLETAVEVETRRVLDAVPRTWCGRSLPRVRHGPKQSSARTRPCSRRVIHFHGLSCDRLPTSLPP